MKVNTLIWTFALLTTLLLTGCHDGRYDHTAENCQWSHWDKLPDNDKRSDLMGWCMTH